MAIPPKLYQWLVGLFASLGSYLFGYDLGVMAGVLISETFVDKFESDDTQVGLIVCLFTVGAFGGAAFAGPAGDYLGRRGTLTLGSIIFMLGGSLQTGAMSLGYLYSGRFFAGLGVGFLVMMVPLYQAELSHPDIRGRMTGLQQFMLGIGAFVASWITYGTFIHLKHSSAHWRIPLALQLVPAVVLASMIWFFPESPRWLIDHGHHDKGRSVLAQLHAHGDETNDFVVQEFASIKASIEYEHAHEAKSYLELFKSQSAFRRLFLCCAVQASIQMTGVAAIQYYAPEIYAHIGISQTQSLQYQGYTNIFALTGEVSCMLFIDRLGRRWTMILGNLTFCITFLIQTILLAYYPPDTTKPGARAAQWTFIVMIWIFNYFFSATAGPLSWIIPSEVFDTRTRSKGVSIATMTSFAFNTMIGQVTPIAMRRLGYRFYYLFIICSFTNALFFYLFLPETARVPLEKMDTIFASTWLVPFAKTEAILIRENNGEKDDLPEVQHEV